MTGRRPIVRLDGISKRYGEAVALETLELDIAPGEFVTLLGPSGCGKTTTLRILGGFETPDTGRVILDGEDVTHRPPNRRNVNMVFQDYALFPHLNVRQNMAFGPELKGMGRRDIERRLDELMAFLELAEYGARYPGQLSGGQRQRVALARALAPDPALLLLDEPLGALDAKLRGQVQKELKSIQRRTGKTFLFVTHDQDEALTMSDRIVVLNEGRVEQDGAPKDLYLHPRSRFVAEFIGETNLLDATVTDVRDGTVAIDWFGYALRGRASGGTARPGREVTASVRLESLGIHRERPPTDNSVCGRVVERTFLGSRVALDILIEETPDATLRAYVDGATAEKVGSGKVWAGWDINAMTILRD